ncbi:ATP-binding protein [Spirulina subsalsa FACHB-351]|uniref:ATP-binding protein n=1 Tax=Spirulina subsalsa FACHB-351 TaxID=234711 RepID=A0ABT3L1R9_9CYAN|nr:ATP-binding protein [Spirulina subsalsa]MCW6035431.1 ATP-binding protein [Spirulina subsalsa FACHB-351]
MSPSNPSIYVLQQKAASLLLYQGVLQHPIGEAFLTLLDALQTANPILCLQAYAHWFRQLATSNQSWQDYLVNSVLWDDNPFSQQVQRTSVEDLPPVLVQAVTQDLQALQALYQCTGEQLSYWVQNLSKSIVAPVPWNLDIPPVCPGAFLHQQVHWEEAVIKLAVYYQQHGCGIFARYRALRWQDGEFVGIPNPDPVQISEIMGYEGQKRALIRNTEFLLASHPALHVLLYGSRGTGKSSLVKGLLNQFGECGLRLVEVEKSHLNALPEIVECLRGVPQKFIIFVDDLSFEENDEAFKSMKVVLEGSVTARAQNVVVYATSNRRHLVREFFSDRPRPQDASEIHYWDTVQEKLSFSDRFGLTLTFEPANQDTYLQIVHHLARESQININAADLEFRAKQWATRNNGRSGRTAKQFIEQLRAELAMMNNGL